MSRYGKCFFCGVCVCVFNFLSSNHATRITMVDHDTHIGPSLPFSIFHLISSHFTPFYLISIIFQSHVLPISSPFTSQIFQVPVASGLQWQAALQLLSRACDGRGCHDLVTFSAAMTCCRRARQLDTAMVLLKQTQQLRLGVTGMPRSRC